MTIRNLILAALAIASLAGEPARADALWLGLGGAYGRWNVATGQSVVGSHYAWWAGDAELRYRVGLGGQSLLGSPLSVDVFGSYGQVRGSNVGSDAQETLAGTRTGLGVDLGVSSLFFGVVYGRSEYRIEAPSGDVEVAHVGIRTRAGIQIGVASRWTLVLGVAYAAGSAQPSGGGVAPGLAAVEEISGFLGLRFRLLTNDLIGSDLGESSGGGRRR